MSPKDTSLDMSDSEDQRKNQTFPSNLTKHTSKTKDDQNSSALKKQKKEEKPKFLKPKCNSKELLGIDCFLETRELWDKFNEFGTEMITTKTGR